MNSKLIGKVTFDDLVASHLSKGSSDLKQKCTQPTTAFLGTVFNALSHGLIHLVCNVRSRLFQWLKLFNSRHGHRSKKILAASYMKQYDVKSP